MPAYVDPHTSFFDKAFNQTSLHDYILSLQISQYGLKYTIFDPSKNRFIGLESFKFVGVKNSTKIAGELDTVFKERDWLGGKFKLTNLIFSHPASTLIPKALFDEKEKATLMDFNQAVEDESSLEFNILQNTETINLYSLPSNLLEIGRSNWNGLSVFHSSTVFIECLLINYKNEVRNNTLFVNVHHDYFEIVFLRDGKLFFHNSFLYKTKEDFIFFLLASIEQLRLNPEEARIILSGNIDKNSIYYEMVLQYIRHSEFIERNDTFRYSYVFDKLLYHQFYILFNCLQCAS